LTQVRLHLERLVEHELVLAHRSGRGQSFVYELCAAGVATKFGDVGLAEISAAMMSVLAGDGAGVTERGPPGQIDSDAASLRTPWRGGGKSTQGGASTAAHHTVVRSGVGTIAPKTAAS